MTPEEVGRKEDWIERMRCARLPNTRAALAEFLEKEEDRELRRKAAHALAIACEIDLCDRLWKIFEADPDEVVRSHLVAAFSASDDKKRAGPLAGCLEGARDPRYRARLAAALVNLGGRTWFDRAREVIEGAPEGERPRLAVEVFDSLRGNSCRQELLERLANLSDRGALVGLIERVWDGKEPYAAGFLEKVAAGGDPCDAAGFLALGALVARGAGRFETLAAGLATEDAELRREVARAVARIGSKESSKTLSRHLKSETDPQVSAAAIEALGRSGEDHVLDLVERHLGDARPAVAAAASRALEKLASSPSNPKARKLAGKKLKR
ncbi:MAG: HEAT repeat domain-containing protein [Planctomycetes bacterium]|nr:HEAT repeat domain-containing protein [Planctomycetota bacterium]